MLQIRITGALTNHGTCHQKVNDRCIGCTGSNFHQGICLGRNGIVLKSLFFCSFFSGRSCLYCIYHALFALSGISRSFGCTTGSHTKCQRCCQQYCKFLFHNVPPLIIDSSVYYMFTILSCYHAKVKRSKLQTFLHFFPDHFYHLNHQCRHNASSRIYPYISTPISATSNSLSKTGTQSTSPKRIHPPKNAPMLYLLDLSPARAMDFWLRQLNP